MSPSQQCALVVKEVNIQGHAKQECSRQVEGSHYSLLCSTSETAFGAWYSAFVSPVQDVHCTVK